MGYVLCRADEVEVPVRGRERGRIRRLGNGDHEIADVRIEIDILIADDESPNQFVVSNDRVRQTGAATGPRQPANGEVEVIKGSKENHHTGRLGSIKTDRLVDTLHVAGRSGRPTGVRRNEASALDEVQASVSHAAVVRRRDGNAPAGRGSHTTDTSGVVFQYRRARGNADEVWSMGRRCLLRTNALLRMSAPWIAAKCDHRQTQSQHQNCK